jgi:phospholipase/carboxylesterase
MKELFMPHFQTSDGYELVPIEAPHSCDLFPDKKQWFKLSYMTEYLIPQIELAAGYVEEQVVKEIDRRGMGSHAYCMVGHSQGAMISMRLALRRIINPQLVVAISASGPFVISEEVINDVPPISIIHGENDAMMPLDKTLEDIKRLERYGISLNLNIIDDMNHEVNQEALVCSKKLIAKALTKKTQPYDSF